MFYSTLFEYLDYCMPGTMLSVLRVSEGSQLISGGIQVQTGSPAGACAFNHWAALPYAVNEARFILRKLLLHGCWTNDLWSFFLQIVRTDLKELRDFNLDGAPYGYTPFCDSRREMDGYRFWKSGYWASHLAGRKYHIRYWKRSTPNTVF